MAKKLDKKQAMDLLLSPHPKSGSSILGVIDLCFKKFLPETPLEGSELVDIFAYTAWESILPARVLTEPRVAGAPAVPSIHPIPLPPEIVIKTIPVTELFEPAPEPPLESAPEPAPEPDLEITPEPTPESLPKPASAPLIPPSEGEGDDFLAAPAVKFSLPIPIKPREPLHSKSLDELLGNVMRPTEPLPRAPAEETTPTDQEEAPALSSASSALMEKLRQQRENLASIIRATEAEEEDAPEGATDLSIAERPAAKPLKPRTPVPISAPSTTFDSPQDWFAAKERQTYAFTKFAFRLTPEEKKVKEYLVGVGEFARKTFVPRSGLMEMKVRLQMNEDRAIAMIWDWLKRGIIEEIIVGTQEEEI